MKRKSNSILISLYFVLSLLICFSFTVGPIGQMRAIAEENDLPSDSVYLGGKVIGLKLPLNAVEVTGFRSIITNDGTVSPAASAGISIGDRIIKAGSKEIKNNKELFDAVDGSDGEIVLTIKRGKTEIEKTVIPAVEKISGEKKIGIFVKDEIDGIGTLTYIKKDGSFGALGHSVSGCNNCNEGVVYNAVITGVQKPKENTVGEIDGYIGNKKLGTVTSIDNYGVYGKIDSSVFGNAIKIGGRASATIGKASIVCSIDENGPKEYSVEIVKTEYQKTAEEKGLVIKITDARLKEKTGGIVQGMSGSPIIQNGKLIGAVSHVFLGDPLRGYGVYVDWMLNKG